MILLAGLLAASCGYYLLALISIVRFSRQTSPEPGQRPPISILKPARGAGETFADELRAHASQRYPEFEILVGVIAGDSKTAATVVAVQDEFPALRIAAIPCSEAPPSTNGKVSVLERLAPEAKNPIWVINDADIAVPPEYLETLAAELSADNTGLVTCLFRAEPGRTPASMLEATWINAEFSAQIITAAMTEGVRFAIGATMAMPRNVHDAVGGFAALSGFVGDDFHLGAKVAASGRRVALSSLPVTTRLADDTWAQVWRHQLRWSRTIRSQRPGGHLGIGFTFGSVWSAAALATHASTLWPLVAVFCALRIAGAVSAARTVGERRPLRTVVLLPLVDLFAFGVWCTSFFSNEVVWAGSRLRLGREGRIVEP